MPPNPKPPQPPTWVLSDGTEVELGGAVRGNSRAAISLRHDLLRLAHGPVWVPMWAPPGGDEPLDLDSADHVDCWIRQIARWRQVTIVSAPEFERLPCPYSTEPRAEGDPEIVY